MEVIDYESSAYPQSDMVGHIQTGCNEFRCEFNAGIHFLTGEIDIGAWSFVYSLLSDTKNTHVRYKSIILNGKVK